MKKSELRKEVQFLRQDVEVVSDLESYLEDDKGSKRICLNCGREFEIRRDLIGKTFGKFCSRKCVGLYRKRRVKRVCLNCGKEFEVQMWLIKEGGGKFCSMECRKEYNERKRVKVKCLNCGKEFLVCGAVAKEGAKFCSKECYWEFQKKRVKVKCLNCGKEFETTESSSKKFCSKKCWSEYSKVEIKCLNCGKGFWRYRSEENRKFCSRECYKQFCQTFEYREKKSTKMKDLWQDSVFREKMAGVMKVICSSPEYREKKSKKIKALWLDPEYKRNWLEKMKVKWSDLQYKEMVVKRTMEALQRKPNGLERAVCELLQNYFTNEWRYVGDGKVFIAGCVPDFIHKEEKWIIEVNGDYWHSLPEGKERDIRKKEVYERCGYRLLEIWESEVKLDCRTVVNKIAEYFYEDLDYGVK
jgi:very-short-patch-repair endonuclease/endogenous inhibitor of DNA gyrase (YacG/DUF329 family)